MTKKEKEKLKDIALFIQSEIGKVSIISPYIDRINKEIRGEQGFKNNIYDMRIGLVSGATDRIIEKIKEGGV